MNTEEMLDALNELRLLVFLECEGGASKTKKKDPQFSVGARLRDKDIWI